MYPYSDAPLSIGPLLRALPDCVSHDYKNLQCQSPSVPLCQIVDRLGRDMPSIYPTLPCSVLGPASFPNWQPFCHLVRVTEQYRAPHGYASHSNQLSLCLKALLNGVSMFPQCQKHESPYL